MGVLSRKQNVVNQHQAKKHGKFCSENQNGRRRYEDKSVGLAANVGSEGQQRQDESKGVGKRSRGVEEEVELRDGEQGQPHS